MLSQVVPHNCCLCGYRHDCVCVRVCFFRFSTQKNCLRRMRIEECRSDEQKWTKNEQFGIQWHLVCSWLIINCQNSYHIINGECIGSVWVAVARTTRCRCIQWVVEENAYHLQLMFSQFLEEASSSPTPFSSFFSQFLRYVVVGLELEVLF